MQHKVKEAVLSTAVVLAVIFVLNRVGPTRAIVQKALLA